MSKIFGVMCSMELTKSNQVTNIRNIFFTYLSPEWISTPPLACAVFKDIFNVSNNC